MKHEFIATVPQKIYFVLLGLLGASFIFVLISFLSHPQTTGEIETSTATTSTTTISEIFKLEYRVTVQGHVQKITILSNGSFTDENGLPFENAGCTQGILTSEQVQSIKSKIIEQNFFSQRVVQGSAQGMVCEGTETLTIALDGKVNALASICNDKPTEETRTVTAKRVAIQNLVTELIKSAEKQECQ